MRDHQGCPSKRLLGIPAISINLHAATQPRSTPPLIVMTMMTLQTVAFRLRTTAKRQTTTVFLAREFVVAHWARISKLHQAGERRATGMEGGLATI